MSGGPTDGVQAGSPAPRMVRRIACGYRLGTLPGDWLQTWRRLDRLLARSELRVRVVLEPLENLPADVDLLVVPPELADAAPSAVQPGVPIVVTTPANAADDFAVLVARLEDGAELTAERVDSAAPETPNVVTYRGSVRLD